MAQVNFIIDNFNTQIEMDLSGQLESQVFTIDASATAVLYVDLSCVLDSFKIQIDSSDVLNANDSDIKYFVDRNKFWKTDEQFSFSINPADAIIDSSGVLDVQDDEKNMVCHDFTRYLALKLFNTAYGVDLFNNELQLLDDIREKTKKVWGNIDAQLIKYDINQISTPGNLDPSQVFVDYSLIVQEHSNDTWTSGGSVYHYGDNSMSDNITKKLLEQIAEQAPSRLATMANTHDIQSLPFQDGDSISFLLTINPEDDQHNLTGVNPFGARTFRIKYILKSNYKSTHNLDVSRDTDEIQDYRYFEPVEFLGGVSLP